MDRTRFRKKLSHRHGSILHPPASFETAAPQFEEGAANVAGQGGFRFQWEGFF
jgi:hypothetical protein